MLRRGEIFAALDRVVADILLQDARLPGLDLEDLVADVRADPRWRAVAVVIFSASIDVHELGERLGVPYLEKPFTPREAIRVLDAALAPRAATV